MYARCDSPEESKLLALDGVIQIQQRGHNLIAWTGLVTSIAKNGWIDEAILAVRRMLGEGILLDRVAASIVLTICDNLKLGQEIHSWIDESRFVVDIFVDVALIDMYGRFKRLDRAEKVFLRIRDGGSSTAAWNAMIKAYAQCGHYTESLELYQTMHLVGVELNGITFVAALSSCLSRKQGMIVYSNVVESGFGSNCIVSNALISMFARFSCVDDTYMIFKKIPKKDLVSWNLMISQQHLEPAFGLTMFQSMLLEGLSPNRITFLAVMKLLAGRSKLRFLQQIDAWIRESGLRHCVDIGNSLIAAYGKCGNLEDAVMVFDGMIFRDVVSWNTLLAVYVENQHLDPAAELLRRMQQLGEAPDRITLCRIGTYHTPTVFSAMQCFIH